MKWLITTADRSMDGQFRAETWVIDVHPAEYMKERFHKVLLFAMPAEDTVALPVRQMATAMQEAAADVNASQCTNPTIKEWTRDFFRRLVDRVGRVAV